jgi:predicted permease
MQLLLAALFLTASPLHFLDPVYGGFMRWIDQLRMRFAMLLGRKQADARLNDELSFHLEEQIAENRAAGMSEVEARQSALRMFGNPALLRDQTRATWSWNSAESLLRELRIALRTLWRTPGFALTAIVIIALGIGANVALFTVVRSVLLKPLPYQDPERLVSVYQHWSKSGKSFTNNLPVDAASFTEWQKAAQDMTQMTMVSPWQNYNVSSENGRLPERVDAAMCSWNFFNLLGVTPMLGRNFLPADDRPEAGAVVILSASFWQRRYSADPSIVGKKIWMNARPYTVIGVLPPSFMYAGAFTGNTNQVWTTAGHEASDWLLHTFEDHEFMVLARLKPRATQAALVSRLNTVQKGIKAGHPEPSVRDSVVARSMLDDMVQDYKTPLYVLLTATGCLLLIACLNVASLLVARTAARSKEMAIRTALGGGRLRLLRERFIESLLLSAAGGAVGLVLAWGAVEWLIHARHEMNRIEAIHIDGVVIAFTLGVILLCTLVSGFIAALSNDSKPILVALQESSRAHSAGQGRAGLRRMLLVLEVGLTVILLVGAGLLLKSYQRLRSTDLGVNAGNILTMGIELPDARYKTPVERVAFFERLIEGVRAIPGVKSAGLVTVAPGQGWGGDNQMSIVEHPPMAKGQEIDLMRRGAEPGYFSAIGLPLLRGRNFTLNERLDRAHVAIISEAVAKLYFPGEDPIGRHIKVTITGDVYEVVGITRDTRWSINQPTMPMFYIPLYDNNWSFTTIVIRSAQNVNALAMPVEKLVGQLDPDLPVSHVETLQETIGQSTVNQQFSAVIVLAFAVVALVLAAVGLYGVLAYLVAQRTGEIGIRIALGAQRKQVLQFMLLDGLWPALAGLVLGLVGSVGMSQLIKVMLYNTEPLDVTVFATVSVALLAVAAAACLVPSWRASRLDPMVALRTE